jgi:peptidoglycan/xylan/chitin deacetylase (PgdA/CDA1 family)
MDLRLQRRVPVLSWDEIGEMSAWGFDIANHSVTHIDMGRTSVTESLHEIQQASRDLAAQLRGVGREKWFAYPFGGPKNLKRETRERLKDIGIECCVSAYGGVNGPNFDPYDILRQGVNHSFSDLAFVAVVEGYRVRCD